MKRILPTLLAACAGVILAAASAAAHPHVWVVTKSSVVYAPDGSIVGIRHTWTFDDMYSTFATQGLDQKTKGEFTREELQPLAQVNVELLKEFDFFTYGKVDGKKAVFAEPKEYHLEFDAKATALILHFLLPLKTPAKAKALTLEVFDSAYFVDFQFAEKDGAGADRRAAGLRVQHRQAAGNDQGIGAAARRDSAGRPDSGKYVRRAVRQQAPGEMSLSRTTEARVTVALVLVAAAASMWLSAGHFDAALAQATNPFGGPRAPAAPPPSDGVIGWMFAKQAEFYRNMSATIRSAKTDGSAVWTLLGISFLYGIFHAAGPGHGKAVISSYVVANNETWRRGVVLSFASALLQAFVAVAIVGIARVVLNATAGQLCNAERVIEIVSYGLIALVGARLIWVKGRGFVNAARGLGRPLHAVGAAVTPPHDHKHHDHDQASRSRPGSCHDHAHHDHAHGIARPSPRSRS